MSTVKPHTSLPWHIGMKPGPMIYGPLGEQVADCRGVMELRESCLDATYIAHACNMYPEMLDMLKTALAYIETPGDLNDGEVRCLIDDLTYTLEQAEGRNE